MPGGEEWRELDSQKRPLRRMGYQVSFGDGGVRGWGAEIESL